MGVCLSFASPGVSGGKGRHTRNSMDVCDGPLKDREGCVVVICTPVFAVD